jgi:hypothetical protein
MSATACSKELLRALYPTRIEVSGKEALEGIAEVLTLGEALREHVASATNASGVDWPLVAARLLAAMRRSTP